ncbi:thioredoxin-disulfide reductase [Archaeoglobus sp.]
MNYDVAIIGCGPAGLTCAIYTTRYGLKTIVFEDPTNPSQLALTPQIENYPGFEGNGFELLNKMKEQAEKFGAEIRIERVADVVKEGELFTIKTDEGVYKAKAIVFATGGKHRKLGVEGEKEFVGRGVSYCAVCDGFFFKGKKVLVVGGGNTALVDAIYLHDLGCDVTIVHRRDEFRAEKTLQDRVFEKGIKVIWNSVVERIEGKDRVERVILRNVKTGEVFAVEVDGVFVAIGVEPNTELAKKLGVELENGYIKVDRHQRTNVEGVFACGDCCNNPLKQVVTACGEGATAGFSAYQFISKNK